LRGADDLRSALTQIEDVPGDLEQRVMESADVQGVDAELPP
jgi:hypothetical protein